MLDPRTGADGADGTAAGVAPVQAASAGMVAPAKVNLALHVVGRRADGYHLLDTLVAFAPVGDTVTATVLPTPGGVELVVTGPFAAALGPTEDNLVVRAARLMQAEVERRGRPAPGVRLVLDKRLPIASGIGGGSADAAATLKLLDRLFDLDLGRAGLARLGLDLGADVPMCVHGAPARVGGIGEVVETVETLPPFGLVLVNPRRPLATPAVFQALAERDNPPLPPLPARFASANALALWLAATRNDLERPAISLEPAIAEVLAALRAEPGCLIARMSGSGATCFGLFATDEAAAAAAAAIEAARPEWWVGVER